MPIIHLSTGTGPSDLTLTGENDMSKPSNLKSTQLPTSPVVSHNGYQNRFVVTADPDGCPYLQEQRLVDGRWIDRPGIGSNTVQAALIAVLCERFDAH